MWEVKRGALGVGHDKSGQWHERHRPKLLPCRLDTLCEQFRRHRTQFFRVRYCSSGDTILNFSELGMVSPELYGASAP